MRANRVLILGTGLLLCAVQARADDPTIVTIGKTGPDREIPVGEAFFVVFKAPPETTRVQPIILRKGSDAVFGGSGKSCSTTLQGFGELVPRPEAGSQKASEVWSKGKGSAYVAAAWDRGTVKGEYEYKVLIPSDKDFFRSGFSYCLFLYQTTSESESVEKRVRKLMDDYASAVKACKSGGPIVAQKGLVGGAVAAKVEKKGKPPEPTDKPSSKAPSEEPHEEPASGDEPIEESDDEAPEPSCEDKAVTALTDGLDGLELSDNVVKDVLSLANAAEKLDTHPTALGSLLATLSTPDRPNAANPASFVRTTEFPLLVPLDAPKKPKNHDDPDWNDVALARAIASLLARTDGLFADLSKPTVSYSQMNGTAVKYLGLRADGQIDVSSNGKATGTKPLKLKTDQLTLSGTSVTARDLVELAQGRIRLDEYVSISELTKQLKSVLADPRAATKEQIDNLELLGTRVDALAGAFRRAFAASEGFQCPTLAAPQGTYSTAPPQVARTGAEEIERKFGEWLRCEIVQPCDPNAAVWTSVDVAPVCSDPAASPNQAAWPGYADPEDTPLDELATTVRDLVAAQREWKAKAPSLAKTANRTVDVAGAHEAKIAFSQSTWLGSYVTPVVGYAYLNAIDEELFYAGVQIHWYPNEINEPQWTNGKRDFRRAFALELAVAPNAGSFGPDDRYDGWKSLPPLFIGGTFHPFPYSSVTAGVAIMDKRDITLAHVQRETDAMFFVAFNVQANIPDLIYKGFNFGQKTEAKN